MDVAGIYLALAMIRLPYAEHRLMMVPARTRQSKGNTVLEILSGGIDGDKWDFLGYLAVLYASFRLGVLLLYRWVPIVWEQGCLEGSPK